MTSSWLPSFGGLMRRSRSEVVSRRVSWVEGRDHEHVTHEREYRGKDVKTEDSMTRAIS